MTYGAPQGKFAKRQNIDDEKWADWEKEHRDDLDKSERLILDGHNRHCSYGIVWGSGGCTCKKGINNASDR